MSEKIILPEDLYSPDQLSSLVLELRIYIGKLRDAAIRAQNTKQQSELPPLSPQLRDLLAAEHDVMSPEELLSELEKLLTTAPVIHITLAASAPRNLKRQITSWFRNEINPTTLLTFAARSDLGGGMLVQAGSKLYDMTFRRRILDNKARISEIASSV